MTDLQFKNGNPGAVQYGNFINYYEFNPPSNRVTLLPTNIWSSRKSNSKVSDQTVVETFLVLDVGCNAGNLTYELKCFLQTHLPPTIKLQILAVDIDPVLIERAKENYHSENVQFECLDCTKDEFIAATHKFLQIHDKCRFDAIFCFSTTMWIHLNQGDEGLQQLLQNICKLCDIFVVEPQPWKCYASAVKRMKGVIEFPHFNDIKMRLNVVPEVERYIVEDLNMYKVFESGETEWKRKIFCFKHIS